MSTLLAKEVHEQLDTVSPVNDLRSALALLEPLCRCGGDRHAANETRPRHAFQQGKGIRQCSRPDRPALFAATCCPFARHQA